MNELWRKAMKAMGKHYNKDAVNGALQVLSAWEESGDRREGVPPDVVELLDYQSRDDYPADTSSVIEGAWNLILKVSQRR